MIQKLFRPFAYISGLKSLQIGLLLIIATAIVGYFSTTHFPDVLSVKIGFSSSVWYFIAQSLVNWLCLSTLLYLAAIILSKSPVRIVDVFGTQALARYPYFIAAFFAFSDSMKEYNTYLKIMEHSGEAVALSADSKMWAIFYTVLTLLMLVWMLVLIFNAYKLSANLQGKKLLISFVLAMIIAVVLSAYLSRILSQIF